jgi:hypothetical protein
LGRERERIRTVFDLLCKTKIHKLEMSFCVYQNVLGFEIAVCDTLVVVQEFEDEDDFGGVEL